MQVNSLKEGILERDNVIENLQRHVLVAQVSNKLLTSEMRERDATIQHLSEQRKAGVITRWKTFAGPDFVIRQACSTGTRVH